MAVIGEGTYVVRGPARIAFDGCEAEIMGSECSGCETVVPVGRTFTIKVKKSGCRYTLTPPNATLEYSRIGEKFYEVKERIVNSFLERRNDGIVFIGPPDKGKSTLSILVHNTLRSRLKEGSTALVTTDIGQNEVYAPCFVSASSDVVLPGVQSRLLDNCFVGSTSPPQAIEKYFHCVNRVVRKLVSEGYKVVVDTDGWINGLRGIYSKLAITTLLSNPLIVLSSLNDRDRSMIEYFYSPNILHYVVEGLETKKREERRLHRVRLIAKELRGASHMFFNESMVRILGLPVFNGRSIDPKTLELRNVVYAEENEGIITLVLRRGSKPVKPKRNVNVLVEGWERGLIASLYYESEVKGLGVVESVDYKRRGVTLVSSYRGPVDIVEIGVARFPEVFGRS